MLNGPGRSVDVGDIEVWVEPRPGTGRAVLLVSGLGYASWCWAEVQELLTRPSVAIDNRGTGRSSKPGHGYSIAGMADDVARAMDALDLDAVDVVGHSMGGYIAQTIALRHPQRVRSLTLVGTSPGGPQGVPVPEATLAAWHEASTLSPADFARRTMPLSLSVGFPEANPERFESVLQARLAHPTPPQCWALQFAACGAFLEEGVDMNALRVPTLIVHGTDDRVVPFANGELLARGIAGSTLQAWEGKGHLPFIEDARRFVANLEAWLA